MAGCNLELIGQKRRTRSVSIQIDFENLDQKRSFSGPRRRNHRRNFPVPPPKTRSDSNQFAHSNQNLQFILWSQLNYILKSLLAGYTPNPILFKKFKRFHRLYSDESILAEEVYLRNMEYQI